MIIKVSRDTGIRTDDLSSVPPVYRYTLLLLLLHSPLPLGGRTHLNIGGGACEASNNAILGYFTILPLSLSNEIVMKGRNSLRSRKHWRRESTSVEDEREIDFDGLVVG